MAEEQKAKYEIIYDMGTELYIAKVQLAELKEQDINARIMKNEMQDQLTYLAKVFGSAAIPVESAEPAHSEHQKQRAVGEFTSDCTDGREAGDYLRTPQSKERKRSRPERDYRYPG